MSDIMTATEMIQMGITAGTGLLGIGVGVGIFRETIKNFKADLERIKLRQAKLRGEDNGGFPVYMTRTTCKEIREKCGQLGQSQLLEVVKIIDNHTSSIRRLDNFARWWMQKEGLTIQEINDILKDNK